MPSLVLFDRRTLIGGDDLQIPSFLTLLVRSFQLIFLLTPLYLHMARQAQQAGGFSEWLFHDPTSSGDENNDSNNNPSCHQAHCFPLFLTLHVFCTTLYVCITIPLELRLYHQSGLGTPTQPELRQPSVRRLMELKLVPMALGNAFIWCLGVAALSYSTRYYACVNDGNNDNGNVNDDDEIHHNLLPSANPHLWWYALILLLLTQLAEIGFSAMALSRVLSLPKRDAMDIMGGGLASPTARGGLGGAAAAILDRPDPHHDLVEDMWHDRCRLFCRCLSVSTCFLFGGREVDGGDYTAIARALADYFEHGHVLDLVPSDIVAGFIMLQRVQRERVLEARRSVIESRRTADSIEDALEEGNRMGMAATTISSLRDSALKRSAQEDIFARSSSSSTPSSSALASPALSRTNSVHSMGPDPLSPMPDPTTPAPRDRSEALSASYHPSALAFRMEHEGNKTWYETTRRSVLCRNDEDDRAAIAEGARFARHALAIYTWVLYVYMHPIKGTCNLACAPCTGRMRRRRCREERRRPARQRGSASGAGLLNELGGDNVDENDDYTYGSCPMDDDRIIGDNLCQVHRAALLAHAGLEDSDLIFAQLNSSFKETPYCIVVDHRWKSVVLSIRGTLSIEDCVVDVLVDPESLEDLGNEYGFDASGQACHSGALHETLWIYNDLKQRGILDSLLLGPNAEYPHYNLRIVGHSLGAACACLLSFMMRKQYPNLRCLCYSPPGGFITYKMATGCKDFVTSYVLDSDLVPRLSVDAMEHLRNEILQLIGRIKVPKFDVLEHAVTGVLPCQRDDEEDPDVLVETNARILHPRDGIPAETEFARQLERVKNIQSERRKSRAGVRDIPLYPPGRMCHLVKTGEKRTCCHGLVKCLSCFTTNVGSEYSAVWIENDDLKEIVVSPTMGTDHFPNRVCLEIEGIARNFGIDTSLGSSDTDRENALLRTSNDARLVSDVIFPLKRVRSVKD